MYTPQSNIILDIIEQMFYNINTKALKGGRRVDEWQQLYHKICVETGKNSLSDEEIAKIALFLQRRLGQAGNADDLSIGQIVHVDSNLL